jgi:GAF domain-containing protein
MNNILRSLNILNWPMWVKLSAGFLFAIAVPAVLLLFIARSSLAEVSSESLRRFLEDQSSNQASEIDAELRASQAVLTQFLSSDENLAVTNRVITDRALQFLSLQNLTTSLQTILRTSNRFTQFYVTDQNGVPLVKITDTRIDANARDTLDTRGAYEQANTALLQNNDQSVAVINDPFAIQMTHVVRNTANEVVGFLIGTLNYQSVIVDRLDFGGSTYPAYSYLVTAGEEPVIFVADSHRDEAVSSIQGSPVIPLALRGAAGIENYRIGGQNGEEVIGHYAAIYNPTTPTVVLFALVSETSASIPFDQANSYFNSARIFPILVGVTLIFVLLVVLFNQIITPSLASLRTAIQGAARGDFDQPVLGANRSDEIGEVSAAFVDMQVQVRNLMNDLEARVAARTRDIMATQEISRFAATQRNLQTLLDQVVQLISEQFPNIYHAQIFLLDQDRLYAVLRASTGEPGKILLARGHRLAVGSVSVIGQVIEQGQIVIARDTATSQVHRRNEFLPDTRAELAIPLRVADQLIGALDVQSKYRNAFTGDEVQVLQTMADQIAVAIENARLYQETVRRLEDIERANRQATISTWQEYIYGQRQRSLISEAGIPTNTDMSELRQQAVSQGKIVMGKPTANNTVPVAVPIRLRGQILGAVEWELPASELTDNKLQLAQELANRLAVSLDNARLFEESQRATERERIVNAIAAKLTPQTEINEILQTAVREVGQALRAPQVSIRLHRSDENGHTNGNGNGVNGNGAANGSNGVKSSHE